MSLFRCEKCKALHRHNWKEDKRFYICLACFRVTWHIKEPNDKKEKRDVIACYKYEGEWRLITREISTLSHATKMSEKYSDTYKVKIIQLGEFLK